MIMAKSEKYLFEVAELTFCSFKILAGGISLESRQVGTFKNWSTLTNTAEVRSFLRLAHFLGNFIPNFVTVADPNKCLDPQGHNLDVD